MCDASDDKHQASAASRDQQRTAATQASRHDRRRMREAMHALEDALASSSPSREAHWMKRVAEAAGELAERMQGQSDEFHTEAGILSDIIADAPRLEPRVRRLREQHSSALKTLMDLVMIARSERPFNDEDVAEIRTKLGDVLLTIRNLHAVESDLVYEAYNVDIGIGD